MDETVRTAAISSLLGPSRLDTTELYTKVAARTVRAAISPLDKLRTATSDQAHATSLGGARLARGR